MKLVRILAIMYALGFAVYLRADCGTNGYADGVIIKRDDVSLDGSATNDYGHWWVELRDPSTGALVNSYGWWPAPYVNMWQTLLGVPGSLNRGFDQDPHAAQGDPGQQSYYIQLPDGMTSQQVQDEIRNWAEAYRNRTDLSWRYPFGLNCHSFQKMMLDQLGLTPCDPSLQDILNNLSANFAANLQTITDNDFDQMMTDALGNLNAQMQTYLNQYLDNLQYVPDGSVTIGEVQVVQDGAAGE